jgi:hypothetical protein
MQNWNKEVNTALNIDLSKVKPGDKFKAFFYGYLGVRKTPELFAVNIAFIRSSNHTGLDVMYDCEGSYRSYDEFKGLWSDITVELPDVSKFAPKVAS